MNYCDMSKTNKSNLPLVSVIVPVYNSEKFLNRCIDSIISQTYENLEILLVDDGSTDRSPSICDDYALKDNRVKAFHQKNTGVSGARNTGLDNCSGEYISFVDSDDYISPQMIWTLFRSLKECEVDYSVCQIMWEKQNGEMITSKNDLARQTKKYTSLDFEKILIYSNGWYEKTLVAAVVNKLYSAYIFDHLRFAGKYAEDQGLADIVNSKKYQVSVVADALYTYSFNESSLSRSGLNTNIIHYLEMLEDRLELYGYDEKIAETVMLDYINVYFDYYWQYKDQTDYFRKNRKRFREYLRDLHKSKNTNEFFLRMKLFILSPKLFEIVRNMKHFMHKSS